MEIRDAERTRNRNTKIVIIIMTIAMLSIGAVVTISASMKVVPTGNKGILITWGTATAVLDEGLHFITPIAQTIDLMSIQVNLASVKADAASQDLQDVVTDIGVNYQLDTDYLLEVYRTLGHAYVSRVTTPAIEESIKATTAQYKAEELITKRPEVNTLFRMILSERLAMYHILVKSVNIVNFDFSPKFTRAIEMKVTAEQQALEAKNRLEQVRYNSQQEVIKAQAEANATITKAKAEAEAIRILNEQLAQSPIYLKYMWLEKWDGELPLVMDSETALLIDLTEITGKNIK